MTNTIFNPFTGRLQLINEESGSLFNYLGEFANQPTGIPSQPSYFFSTNLNELFQADLVRNKWVSVNTYKETIGSIVNLTAGSYFRLEGVAMSPNLVGIYPDADSTLVGYTFNRSNNTATKLWIFEGPISIPPFSTTGSIEIDLSNNLTQKDNSLNVDFASNIIAVRNATNSFGGGLITQPILTLFFKHSFPFLP